MFDYKPRDRFSARVDENLCRAGVLGDSGWNTYQCSRKPVDGGKYCRQHSPEARKARQEASDRRRKERWEARERYAETAAVALLREKGYAVTPPAARIEARRAKADG